MSHKKLRSSFATLFRHLIETATGFWTGSSYNDRDLFRGGLKGELTNIADFSKVIGVKVHTKLSQNVPMISIFRISHLDFAESLVFFLKKRTFGRIE